MKPYKQEEHRHHSQPSGAWKKKYKCKRLKGDHDLELVKMNENWSFKDEHPEETVEEHYAREEKEYEDCLKKQKKEPLRGWCSLMYHYKCKACGYKKYGFKKKLKI